MKTFSGMLAALTVMFATTYAISDASSALEMAQASYPKCTVSVVLSCDNIEILTAACFQLGCLAKLIPQSSCSLTDVNCLCTDISLNGNLTLCVVESCTTYEGLSK